MTLEASEESREDTEYVEQQETDAVAQEVPEQKEPQQAKSIRDSLSDHLKATDAPKEETHSTQEPKKEGARPEKGQVTEPTILPPQGMTAEEQAAFNKLDNQSKAFISRRMHQMTSDYTRKTQELGEQRKQVTGIMSAIEPHADHIRRSGADVGKIVESSIAWDKYFKEDPVSAAREFLDMHGVDPSELGDADYAPIPRQENGNYLTPQEAERLFERRLAEREQANRTHQVYNVINSFIEDKPLFKDPGTAQQLEAEMAPVVATIRHFNPNLSEVETLERAYNEVLDKSPRFAAVRQQQEAQQRAEKSRQEAEKARKASRSISGTPGAGATQTRHKSIRDSLRANLKDLS